MTLSSSRVAPKVGHMDTIKRDYRFLFRFKDFNIRFLTELPNLSACEPIQYNWVDTVCDVFEEELTEDAPEPFGKEV